MLFLIPLLSLLPVILADTVYLSLSLASQYPAIARAGQPYSFNVSRDTFATDSSILTYSATNLPTWLAFDATNLSFSGTPPLLATATTDPRSVRLTATTADGHTSTDSFTLSVEVSQGVTVLNAVVDQFKSGKAAITSAYALLPLSPFYPGVRVPPGWSFSVGFLPVFQTPNKRKVYYSATQANGSTLPEWLHFNDNTITFDGVAPSPSALQRMGSDGMFRVRIWGSDVSGYRDEYQEFAIRVAAKTIEQVHPLAINLTAGYPFTEPLDLYSAFRISGRQLNRSDIATLSVDANTYKINLDNSSISGSPPVEYGGRTETLYMSIESLDGDVINSTMSISYFSSFFTSDNLGPVHAVPGDRIKLPIHQYLTNHTSSWDINATYSPPEASRWLTLDEIHLEITGDVPADSGIQNVTVHLKAADKEHSTNSYADLVINLSEKAEDKAEEKREGLSGATIGGIVVGVLLNVALALVFLWMWMRRRQRKQAGEEGDKAEGYDEDAAPTSNQDPEKFAAGPIYRAESFMEVRDENELDDRATEEEEAAAVAGEKNKAGWHKRTSTVPATVLMTLHQQGPLFPPGTPTSQVTRQTDSPSSIASAASKARKFLANPFTTTKVKQIPHISNPVLHPSFSNAAFQASLAIAVDSKGIVSRGGTYDEGIKGAPTATTDISEFTPSGTFVGTHGYGASTAFTTNGYTTSGAGDETDFDRPTSASEYTGRYTSTDVTGSEGFEVGRDAAGASEHASAAGDSSVVGKRGSGESGEEWKSNKESDRASWDSGAPFVWNTDVGGGAGSGSGAGSGEIDAVGMMEEETDGDGGQSRRGSTQAETTEYGWTEEGGMTEETIDSDPPIQRSDFRPRSDNGSPGGSYLGSGSDEDDRRRSMSVDHGGSTRGAIRHEVVTPSNELENADFSIDNIHFPTESDIARTEASSDPSELDPSTAVIRTASRISARHTLDSPLSGCGSGFEGSPNSDYTERMPHSPVGPAHSRLVNLSNQRQVVVRPLSAGRREESQTAVMESDSEAETRVSYYEYPEEDDELALPEVDPASPSGDSGETTPQARPRRVSIIRASAQSEVPVPPMPTGYSVASLRSNASSKKGKHRARNSSVSIHNINRSRSPTPPMPESFPSLPALPTGRSIASVKSVKSIIQPNSNRSSTNTSSSTSSRLPSQTRVLLGVNEPFHFYPPLLLASPTGMSSTTAYTLGTTYTSSDGKPLTPEGARYEVYEEKRAGDAVTLEAMPEWLHWEDMELWGVPGEEVKGRWDVRVVETRDGAERVVGRFALEVVGR